MTKFALCRWTVKFCDVSEGHVTGWSRNELGCVVQVGEEAKKLFDEAQVMLQEFIEKKHVTLNGMIGIYPANAVGDDIEVYADESRGEPAATFYGLRQQSEKDDKADPYASTLPPTIKFILIWISMIKTTI